MKCTAKCESCNGTGRRALTSTEERTLAAVGAVWVLTELIAFRLPGVKRTAVCNRLVKLHALGLVERRDHPSHGKLVEWRRAP
jgi:hypothetical protein